MAKAHFTKSWVENIESPEQRLTFTDDSTRGLTLLVNPTGVKTFYVTRKFRGRVERILLGRFPELTLVEARKKAAYFQVQFDAGVNPNEARRQSREELTLDAFFEVYYQDHCEIKNRRPSDTRANYNRYLAPRLGRKQLSAIDRADIKAMMRYNAERGRKRTANNAHTLVRAMFNKAIAWEYFDGRNPAEHIERYPEKVRTRRLMPDEVPRFLDALSREESETNRDAITLLLYTGARLENVLSMHWLEVDLDNAIWTIPRTKNGDAQRVVLTTQALEILKRRKRDASSVFVLPGNGKKGHIDNLTKAWNRLLDRAGIEDLRRHDLRRTLASTMADMGANQAQIQMMLGHRSPQSAQSYVHPDLESLRATVGSATQRLSAD